jgi:hypothetical protein
MTPGRQRRPGVFCWAREASGKRRRCEARIAGGVRRAGDAGAVWIAGAGAAADRDGFPVGNAGGEFAGVLSAGRSGGVRSASFDAAAGVARGDDGGILGGVHDVFDVQLGDGEVAGGWRVGESGNLYAGERGGRDSGDRGRNEDRGENLKKKRLATDGH